MLTPTQIDELNRLSWQITDPVIAFLISEIAKRIAEAGQITSTAAYQVWRAQTLGVSQKEIKKAIAKFLKKSQSEIESLMRQTAEVGYSFDIKELPTEEAIPFSENQQIQDIVDSAVEMVGEKLENIIQTTGYVTQDGQYSPDLTEDLKKSCDFAFNKVVTGAQDYNSAIREAVKNLEAKGIQTVDYETGIQMELGAAVRRNVMGGIGLMQEQISQTLHDQLDYDGWEISAHIGSAPDHEPIQGLQYTDAEYKALNNSLVRRIGTLNCGHAAFPIRYGIFSPQYTPEELADLRKRNRDGIDYRGRHYTQYEATQRQRDIERAMRKQKRKILTAEAAGDKKLIEEQKTKYQILEQEYRSFSRAANLRPQWARSEVFNFGPDNL